MIVVISFINPEFIGLSDIITTLIITTASLLGMTTIENLKFSKKKDEGESDKE